MALFPNRVITAWNTWGRFPQTITLTHGFTIQWLQTHKQEYAKSPSQKKTQKMWTITRLFLWQRAVGEVNGFSSQIFREKRQTGRKEEERLKRLSMGDKSGMRQVKGHRWKEKTRGDWRGRELQMLAGSFWPWFSPPAPIYEPQLWFWWLQRRSCVSLEMKAQKLVAFILVTSCLFFQINHAWRACQSPLLWAILQTKT